MCPGIQVADRNFAVAIMRLLWGFKIGVKPGFKTPLNMKEFAHEVPGVAAPDMPVTIVVRPEKKAFIDGYYKQEAQAREPMVGIT